MKEALEHFAAYTMGSASKERLLYGPNHLLHGSFNSRPRPELNKHSVSTALFQQR